MASVLAVGILAGVLALQSGEQRGAGDEPGFVPLKGRWVRLDAGYVLEIRNVGARGAIDAVYLNPRPIHVAGAQATREGSALKVVVDLNAPGYPGSTYTLTQGIAAIRPATVPLPPDEPAGDRT